MNQIKEKINELPPSWQNNARDIFRSDLERATGDKSKEYFFAQKWGLDYDYIPGKDDGEEPQHEVAEYGGEVEYSDKQDLGVYL